MVLKFALKPVLWGGSRRYFPENFWKTSNWNKFKRYLLIGTKDVIPIYSIDYAYIFEGADLETFYRLTRASYLLDEGFYD